MMFYTFSRVPGGGYDMWHAEDCYDGRFSRAQLGNFIAQLVREGHSVTDGDRWCEAESVDDLEPEGGSVHAIYEIETGRWVADVPYLENDPQGNRGLPDWFFGYDRVADTYALDQNYDSITVHPSGSAEWVPAIGPASVWHSASAGLLPREEMWRQNEQWMRVVYGLEPDPLESETPAVAPEPA